MMKIIELFTLSKKYSLHMYKLLVNFYLFTKFKIPAFFIVDLFTICKKNYLHM